jgi:DEAD/DEAH box helicase domain-containing protein
MFRKTATDFIAPMIDWMQARGEIAWVETRDSKPPSLMPLPANIDPSLRAALKSRGIDQLYTHQFQAWELARKGTHCVIVTPTASGKTLCYNLPVVQSLIEDEHARALYLFPTKALSQDQQAELNEVALGASLPIRIQTYDGDTPSSLRTVARTSGRIIISNPDMLHTGILPNHTKWINFFSGLKYVVIDEMHTYKGVFGSHVGNVIRRLKRIAAFYGAHPCFILCSATIGNPKELAQSLIEDQVAVIDHNGAGSGAKTLVFYNPPLVDAVRGLRKSAETESRAIALELLRRGVKTILFARSRVQVELVAAAMNKSLENIFNRNSDIHVSPYRSGLLPSERRAIERGLREGGVQGVVSTNALELGIDIGGLDAAVIAGYPGSTASFWQQSGRAGRKSDKSIAIFVASSAPLDQYLARHSEYFLSQSPEKARVDLDNPYIFMDHAKCSAFELPFGEGEGFGNPLSDAQEGLEERAEFTEDALALLEESGSVRRTKGRWHWADEGYPSERISLRSASADNVVIVDTTNGTYKAIGEMDRPSAKQLIFENAIYIHLGTQYIVRSLDIEGKVCKVERSDVEYWTDSIVKTDLSVLTEDAGEPVFDEADGQALFSWSLGDVLVRNQVEKFKKLTFETNENIGYGDIFLPPEEMQTRSLSITFPPDSLAGKKLGLLDMATKATILVGMARILRSLTPVFILCEPRDIGVSERVRDPHFSMPTIHLFDTYPGGTGLAEALSTRLFPLMKAGRERLEACPCAKGCPSCIGADIIPEQGKDKATHGAKAQIYDFFCFCAGIREHR